MIEQYLADLRGFLRVGLLARRRILDEVRDHLCEAAAFEQARGASPEEAERRAVERFGDARRVAAGFAEVDGHDPLSLLWLSVSAASVAALLAVLRGAAQVTPVAAAPIVVAETLPPPAPPIYEHMNNYSYVHMSGNRAHSRHRPTPVPAPTVAVTPAAASAEVAAEPAKDDRLALLDFVRPLLLPSPPAEAGHVTNVLPATTPPEPLDSARNLTVHYPAEARWMAIEGDVSLIVHVGEDGRVREAQVTRGLGYGLDEMALELAHALRFHPARDREGRAVDAWTTWTIRCHRERDSMAVPVFVNRGTGPRPYTVDKRFRI